MIVVPVLIINCQVSEYPKRGPVTAQTTMTAHAKMKVEGLPHCWDVHCAARAKASPIVPRVTVDSLEFSIPVTFPGSIATAWQRRGGRIASGSKQSCHAAAQSGGHRVRLPAAQPAVIADRGTGSADLCKAVCGLNRLPSRFGNAFQRQWQPKVPGQARNRKGEGNQVALRRVHGLLCRTQSWVAEFRSGQSMPG